MISLNQMVFKKSDISSSMRQHNARILRGNHQGRMLVHQSLPLYEALALASPYTGTGGEKSEDN